MLVPDTQNPQVDHAQGLAAVKEGGLSHAHAKATILLDSQDRKREMLVVELAEEVHDRVDIVTDRVEGLADVEGQGRDKGRDHVDVLGQGRIAEVGQDEEGQDPTVTVAQGHLVEVGQGHEVGVDQVIDEHLADIVETLEKVEDIDAAEVAVGLIFRLKRYDHYSIFILCFLNTCCLTILINFISSCY